MPDRHAKPSFTVRPRTDVRDRLEQHLAATGAVRNAWITEAITEKLERDMSITDAQITDLQREAGQAGDIEMAAICGQALDGDQDARAECEQVIADARAMEG